MARTKGSKNKPKTINTVQNVDWETLAKRLQQALASEIREHDETKKDLVAHQASIKKAAAKIAIYKTERKMLEELLSDVMTEAEDGNDPV